MNKEKYAAIFINADEPADVRRMKGYFRRVAYKAKSLGKDVTFRYDWIQIDGTTYKSTELEKIPSEYCPENFRQKATETGVDGALAPPSGDETTKDAMAEPQIDDKYNDPKISLKLTKSGLTFSGPAAFCSNMHHCDFILMTNRTILQSREYSTFMQFTKMSWT